MKKLPFGEVVDARIVVEELEPFGLLVKPREPGSSLKALEPRLLGELTQAHRFIVLRDFESLGASPADFVNYAESWGEILHWNFGAVLDLVVHDDPNNYLFTTEDVPFHWDGAFARVVPRFMLFRCLRAPSLAAGGQTLLCDTVRLCQKLDVSRRERWQHTALTYRTEQRQHYGGSITQTMVVPHPTTGEWTLRYAEPVAEHRLNPLFIDHPELSDSELSDLHQEMRSLLYAPEVCVAHPWEAGDVLIVDNHALLHGRRPFLDASSRHLQRIHVI